MSKSDSPHANQWTKQTWYAPASLDGHFHEVMLQGETGNDPPVEIASKVRREMQRFPETKATFERKDVCGYEGSKVSKELLEFCGTWRAPDRFQAQSNTVGERFVNPNHVHARRYADVLAQCACGAYVGKVGQGFDPYTMESEHEDHCTSDAYHASIDQLKSIRRSMAPRLSQMGWTTREIAKRLGLSLDSTSKWCTREGISLGTHRDEYRRMRAATAWLLRIRGHDPRTIANAYGVGVSTIRSGTNHVADHGIAVSENYTIEEHPIYDR